MSDHDLNSDEARFFHDNGYAGPFALCPPDEMASMRSEIERIIGCTEEDEAGSPRGSGSPNSSVDQSRHVDSEVIWRLCSHPAIVARIACLMGPDLMVWRTNLWNKRPARGGKLQSLEIPWHQDWYYWSLEPMLSVTAWVAVDPASVENSCVQIIPGSHKQQVPHVKTEGMHFQTMADPRFVDTCRAVDMELRPGEFFLFNERTLHHSFPNRSERRRLGVSVRLTVPFVRVSGEEDFVGHPMFMVSGQDRFGFNRMGAPPGTACGAAPEPRGRV